MHGMGTYYDKKKVQDNVENTMPRYHETYAISHTLVGNKIVHHTDVVGVAPTGDAPTTSSFST